MKINKRLCISMCLLCSLLGLVTLSACSKQMNMNTVLEEPNFAGTITEVYDNSILVQVNEYEEVGNSSDQIDVSLDVEIKDSLSDYSVGDEVRVYFDGQIAETYPAQVRTVYAIIILNEAEKPNDTSEPDNSQSLSEPSQSSSEELGSLENPIASEPLLNEDELIAEEPQLDDGPLAVEPQESSAASHAVNPSSEIPSHDPSAPLGSPENPIADEPQLTE